MMAISKKTEKTVGVDLPVTLSYNHKQSDKKTSVQGVVKDLSINEIGLSLPLSFEQIDENDFDISLDLPNPFVTIKSRGKVQWKTQDKKNSCVQCQLKLEPMTLKQLSDIDCIVEELSTQAEPIVK